MTELAQTFAVALQKVYGECELVADLSAARQHIGKLLQTAGVRRLALSDAPLVTQLAAQLGQGNADLACLPHNAERAALLAADAGLTAAQIGIAETGTLVLASAQERHRLASLLPPLHIALLPVSRLVATLGAALTRLAPQGSPESRAITFITGPSRTADIELQLVVGVHGPSRLVVVLVLDQ